jgi:ketosteroid isomerase-like protein
MERIKLAISQAREAAERPGQAPSREAIGAPIASAPAALVHAEHSRPAMRGWMAFLPVLVVLTAGAAYWVGRSGASEVQAPVAVQLRVAPSGEGTQTPTAPSPEVVRAAPGAGDPPVPQNDAVVASVEAWRLAWSSRDLPGYLAAYSDAFLPPGGLSRDEWVANRQRNVAARKAIEVQVSNLQVWFQGERLARASFLQDYASGGLREVRQPKTLDLVKEADGRWRILAEWQGDPPPRVITGGK